MYKAVLYQGEELLGEVEIYPEKKEKIKVKEIKISQFSQASERCPPLCCNQNKCSEIFGFAEREKGRG